MHEGGQDGSMLAMLGQGFHPAGRYGQGLTAGQQLQPNAHLRLAPVLNQEHGHKPDQPARVQDDMANQGAVKEVPNP